MLRRAFDAKFWGHITTIQAVLPHLAPAGSITLLGAVTARAGMPGTAGIAAINGAVEALVKPLAAELAPIRVNGVSPGLVDTPWWNGLPDDARQAYFHPRRPGPAGTAHRHRRRHRRRRHPRRDQPQPHRHNHRNRRRRTPGVHELAHAATGCPDQVPARAPCAGAA